MMLKVIRSLKISEIILVSQLTSPVRWTQSVNNMINDNVKVFIECGPGRVLQGLVKKINRDSEVSSL